MKYLAIAVSLLFAGVGSAKAGLSDIGKSIYEDTHVTLLKGAHPAYFYDLGEGSGKSSQAGVIDHVLTYKFISADLGWRSAISGGSGVGVGGIGVQLDQLIGMVLPPVTAYVNSIVPTSMQGFWNTLFMGLDTGWDTTDAKFHYAFHTGINFSW